MRRRTGFDPSRHSVGRRKYGFCCYADQFSTARSAWMALTTAWLIALVEIKSVRFAIIGSGRTRERNGAADRRQQPHISDDCAQIHFLEVGQLVPGHPLPMELPAIPANAAANSPRQLTVAPGTDPGLRMRGDVACPQGTKWFPANWRAAAAVRSMTQRTAYRVKIMTAKPPVSFSTSTGSPRGFTRTSTVLPLRLCEQIGRIR